MPHLGGGGPAGQFSVGDAFNYGWSKFQQNVGPIVLATLAYVAVALVVTIIWYLFTGLIVGAAFSADDGGGGVGFIGLLFSAGLFGLVFTLLGYLIQAGIVRGALAITYGQPLEVKTMFTTDGIGQILLAALIVGVASGIGFLLCYIPGLIVLFFAQFVMYFVIDKRLPAVEAIKASVALINKNVGTMVALFIASAIAMFIGGLLCGVGYLVAFPIVVIAQAYAYRSMQGEPVAPA